MRGGLSYHVLFMLHNTSKPFDKQMYWHKIGQYGSRCCTIASTVTTPFQGQQHRTKQLTHGGARQEQRKGDETAADKGEVRTKQNKRKRHNATGSSRQPGGYWPAVPIASPQSTSLHFCADTSQSPSVLCAATGNVHYEL